MYPRTLLVFAVTIALAPPAARAARAQDGPTPEAHGERRRARPDPVVLEGPPAPAEFARIVQLPADKVAGYTQLYDRFMNETRPQRDSLAAMRRDRRESADSGDRETGRRHRGQFRPLAEDLARQQAAFDDTLKPMLAKDQWKRYQTWRDAERQRAAEAWKDRRRRA